MTSEQAAASKKLLLRHFVVSKVHDHLNSTPATLHHVNCKKIQQISPRSDQAALAKTF